MSQPKSEKEVRAFYRQWASPVLDFCRRFHGDQARAEEATAEGFLKYLRSGFALDLGRLPDQLLRSAVDACKHQRSPRNLETFDSRDLGTAILSLPCDQRAVFILRGVLGMCEGTTAVATKLPRQRVRELRFQALLSVREFLSKDLWKEQIA